jgi:DNA repair protein RadB
MADSKISAGSYDLNKFLFGGYETDVITTIYGPGGSGKTNLCMLSAISQAKKGNKVIYIDTEGGFSVERAKQLAGENTPLALQNIFLLKPTSFKEQKEAFESLNKQIKTSSVSLIIIDSIAMLYRLELADASKISEDKIRGVNQCLASQLRELNEIARKQNIPILVTNQVYGEFMSEEDFRAGKERTVSMVGGDLLKYWSKCILEVKNQRGKRTLAIKKHRSLPEKEMDFEIINEGIRKKGWI